MRKLVVPIFFVFAVIAGFRISTESWNGSVYVYMGEQRSPAALREARDFSAVDRKAISGNLSKQLLASAKLKELNGYIGVTLGHPLFKRARGTGEFACPVHGRPGVFDKVELVFMGTGVSEGGEPPTMVVEGECAPGSTLNEMRTIWIPLKAIMASAPQDQEMQLFGDQPVTVRLRQIPSQWPENWVLQSVKLYRENNPEESMLVDSKGVREGNPKLIQFGWRAPAGS
jgi:hypothetical protein